MRNYHIVLIVLIAGVMLGCAVPAKAAVMGKPFDIKGYSVSVPQGESLPAAIMVDGHEWQAISAPVNGMENGKECVNVFYAPTRSAKRAIGICAYPSTEGAEVWIGTATRE